MRPNVHFIATWLLTLPDRANRHPTPSSLFIYKSFNQKMPSLSAQKITDTLSHYDGLIRQALEEGNVVEMLTKHDEALVSH